MKNFPNVVLSIALSCCAAVSVPAQVSVPKDALLVEAESFADKGGWVVDQQFVDVMGSPILLAHGMGEPVADARTEVTFPKPGEYRVFVRTRNWVAPWTPQHAPGKFRLSVDGQKSDTVFGIEGNPWHWQDGGIVTVTKTKVQLALHDLTGFDGRLDALLFTTDTNYAPSEDAKEIETLRRKLLGLPAKATDAPEAKEGPFDFVVVGGGFSGICASVGAARLGCKVALIQDRPVLGGNNSSEIRVGLHGRIGYPPYPNLGNLVHELDPLMGGNAQDAGKYGDAKKLAVVQAEKNITLYLNTRMTAVETEKNADGSITIKSVIGKNIENGTETKFVAKTFADCTGDGNLGFIAGAEWRMGRESKAETGETHAPAEADSMTMGASVMWNSVVEEDADGRPVETTFPELPWAVQFDDQSAQRLLHGNWDWETGMNFDQILEFERIRDHGLRAVYGHWAYMKNRSEPKWKEQVKNRKLGWVAYISGKRESRRLMGDIVLKEQDVVQGKIWPDASAVTTWTIDLHYPHEHNTKFFPGEEFRASGVHHEGFRPYALPYRCFYSKNVSNLFMAGRCISVTHVVLGSIRVMRTCGMTGEVVGMAASICKEHGTTPRGVYARHLEELKRLMEKGVGPKPKMESYWPSARPFEESPEPDWLPRAGRNLARDAEASASSGGGAQRVNDGKFSFWFEGWLWGRNWKSNAVPTGQPVAHWVELRFPEPVSADAVRILSGGLRDPSPITAFVLQWKDGDRWVDIPETKTENNSNFGIGKRFTPATSDAFRLLITETPENVARIDELELYHIDE